MNSYSDFINYLNKSEKIGIKFGLENTRLLLERLGSPHKKLRCIHVAGTNGKGSVCAMLSSVLNQTGIKTGLYTSPHLVDIRERIRIQERDITEQELLQVAKKIIPLASPETTYFELLTVIAIDFFYEHGAELVILETGMGGRLDATNVCYGEIAIITDISLDHTQYLGKTVEDITKEKMAIVKDGAKVIMAKFSSNDYEIYSRKLDYQTVRIGSYDNIKLNLSGDHQVRNCSLALKAIDVLREKGYNVPSSSAYAGLANVNWPGRFQVISKKPLVILDGAHNPGAAVVLADTVKKYIGGQVQLIIGMLKDKDYESVLDVLVPIAKKIVTVTPKNERALSGSVLKDLIKNRPVEYIPSVIDAMRLVDDNLPVVIAGSLFLVGEVLENVRGSTSNMSSL